MDTNGDEIDADPHGNNLAFSCPICEYPVLAIALNNARSINDLRIPPANRLEALRGNRKGQHSIRINDQWRICFVWMDRDAVNVEIVDYH